MRYQKFKEKDLFEFPKALLIPKATEQEMFSFTVPSKAKMQLYKFGFIADTLTDVGFKFLINGRPIRPYNEVLNGQLYTYLLNELQPIEVYGGETFSINVFNNDAVNDHWFEIRFQYWLFSEPIEE